MSTTNLIERVKLLGYTGVMSEFAHQIRRVIENYGSATALSKSSGVHHTIISRLANDKNTPDQETVRKLCTSVEDSDAAELLVAYLNDSIPKGCGRFATVHGNITVIAEDHLEYESTFKKLHSSDRETIDHLAKMCLDDRDFSRFLRELVAKLDPKWAFVS